MSFQQQQALVTAVRVTALLPETRLFMSELFWKIASRSIIDSIKETGFYRKI